MLAGGILMLLVGGRLLVGAAIALASRLGVPPLLIGLTVVAWGTSTPELAFNLAAAIQNRTALVFGNVMGASLANLGLGLAIAAMVCPLHVDARVVRRELPLLVIQVAMMIIVAFVPVGVADLARIEGVVLLGLFAAYSAAVIVPAVRRRGAEPELEREFREAEAPDRARPLWQAWAMLVAGMALLAAGGSLCTDGAAGVARALGLGERLIALTIVSLGTTTPEIITGVIAVRKGHVDLAVGNAVGSCLFNFGFIFAVATAISPAPLPEGGLVSLWVMLGLSVLILPLSRASIRPIGKAGGATLMAVYAGLLAYEAWRALATR